MAAALREWDRPGASAVLVEEEEEGQAGAASPTQAAEEKSEQERQREVALALRQAEAAMHSAESRLEDIPNLPSARLKREVHACSGPRTTSACEPCCPCSCYVHAAHTIMGESLCWWLLMACHCLQCMITHMWDAFLRHAVLWVAGELPAWLRSALGALRTAALLGAAVLCHMHGPALQIGSAIVVGAALGSSGYRKGSLSASGSPSYSSWSML